MFEQRLEEPMSKKLRRFLDKQQEAVTKLEQQGEQKGVSAPKKMKTAMF
jgi:hypothetical protein